VQDQDQEDAKTQRPGEGSRPRDSRRGAPHVAFCRCTLLSVLIRCVRLHSRPFLEEAHVRAQTLIRRTLSGWHSRHLAPLCTRKRTMTHRFAGPHLSRSLRGGGAAVLRAHLLRARRRDAVPPRLRRQPHAEDARGGCCFLAMRTALFCWFSCALRPGHAWSTSPVAHLVLSQRAAVLAASISMHRAARPAFGRIKARAGLKPAVLIACHGCWTSDDAETDQQQGEGTEHVQPCDGRAVSAGISGAESVFHHRRAGSMCASR